MMVSRDGTDHVLMSTSAGRAAGSRTPQLPKRYLPFPYATLQFFAPDEYHRPPAPDGRRITGDELADALVIKTPVHLHATPCDLNNVVETLEGTSRKTTQDQEKLILISQYYRWMLKILPCKSAVLMIVSGQQICERLRVLIEDEINQKLLYVTEDDIKAPPCFSGDGLLACLDETLIAIKAPHSTTLEVPDPDEVSNYLQRYMIVLRSTMGLIDV
ncbi:hypothetical protein C4D60_Mb05t17950 [Musa balbisiana]|uniref:E2F transcription factor CC-MB domain-containing protein n=1 Tax=Musa balbisiana TaxID=52838 RepID=A0A4S8JWY6_MUSBA|nr:hypothetical protein C4D60_Mb05t17950 [Musa balbisiana]